MAPPTTPILARPIRHRPTPVRAVPPSDVLDRRFAEAAVRRVLAEGGPRPVFQPQLSLSRLTVTGYEALARFPDRPLRGTESWFALARRMGVGPTLEAAALNRALLEGATRPAGTLLAVNLSPDVIVGRGAAVLPDDLTGIEIELTEQEWISGSELLRSALDGLRERGARIAIDDVGAAYSGLRRVMDLAPDRIKIDRHLVHGVAGNTAKAALIRAVVEFASHVDARVCAEGVESLDDLEALAALDVGSVQGFAVGRPEEAFGPADPAAVGVARASLDARLQDRLPSPTAPAPTMPVEEFLRRLTTVRDLAELARLADLCASAVRADRIAVSLLEGGSTLRTIPVTGTVTAGASQGRAPQGRALQGGALQGTVRRLAGLPSVRRALEQRSLLRMSLVPETQDGRAGGDAEAMRWVTRAERGLTAALLVPVISRDKVIGLLECYRRQETPWSLRDIRQARYLASLMGPSLELHRS